MGNAFARLPNTVTVGVSVQYRCRVDFECTPDVWIAPVTLIHHSWVLLEVTETGMGYQSQSQRKQPDNTVPGRGGSNPEVVEFVADNPGDWAMHCHMNPPHQ